MNMLGNKDLQDDRLIIFGRYPVPGQTKIRLIPDLGSVGAAELQRQLTEKVITTARAFTPGRGIDLNFHFEGGNTKKMAATRGPRIKPTFWYVARASCITLLSPKLKRP